MVTLSTQAQIAIRSLLPLDRERIQHHISLLEQFPRDDYVRQKVRKLSGPDADDLYIMRATPTLRILFRHQGDSVEVVDIMTHERLQRMHSFAS
jgi:hypothetical protein